MRARPPIEEQHRERRGERRKRHQHQHRRRDHLPGEDGNAPHRHPGRAIDEDRDQEVDRSHDRRDAGQDQAQAPHVLAGPVHAQNPRQRRVGGPARRAGAALEREAREHREAAQQEQPVRVRVEARECHVGRPHHQGQQKVRDPEAERRDEQEDHRGAVDREDLVVLVRRDQRLVGMRQLQAHDVGQDSGGEKEEDRRRDVIDADPLVVGGQKPAEQPLFREPSRLGERDLTHAGRRSAARNRSGGTTSTEKIIKA